MNGLAIREKYNSQPAAFAFCNGRPAANPAIALNLLGLWVRNRELDPRHLDRAPIRAVPRGVEVFGRLHNTGSTWLVARSWLSKQRTSALPTIPRWPAT